MKATQSPNDRIEEQKAGRTIGGNPPVVGRRQSRCSPENGYENGYENCIYSTNNIHMSNEDDKHDTHYINKNDTNNARKLHE